MSLSCSVLIKLRTLSICFIIAKLTGGHGTKEKDLAYKRRMWREEFYWERIVRISNFLNQLWSFTVSLCAESESHPSPTPSVKYQTWSDHKSKGSPREIDIFILSVPIKRQRITLSTDQRFIIQDVLVVFVCLLFFIPPLCFISRTCQLSSSTPLRTSKFPRQRQ